MEEHIAYDRRIDYRAVKLAPEKDPELVHFRLARIEGSVPCDVRGFEGDRRPWKDEGISSQAALVLKENL